MAQGQRNRLRDQIKRRSRTATGIDGSSGRASGWLATTDNVAPLRGWWAPTNSGETR